VSTGLAVTHARTTATQSYSLHTMSVEASWQRADAALAKHEAKMAAKEAKAAADERARANRAALLEPSAKKPKHEKKIVSSAEVRQRKMRAPQAGTGGADEEPVQQLRVFKDDGSDVMYAIVVADVLSFLQEHEPDVGLDELRRAVGLDMLQQDGALLAELEHHPRIERIATGSGDRLRYDPPYGIRNRGALVHVLTRAEPTIGDSEPGAPRPILRSELTPDETYTGIDVDLDELLAEGRVARVEPSDKKHSDFLLFAMPAGRPAIEEVRELWRRERVPQGPALQEELLKRNLRSKEELKRRKDRKAAEVKAAEELRKALEGKKDRTGAIRTWKNTHLGTADELGAIFKR